MARLELDKTRMMHEERRKTLSEETKHANQVYPLLLKHIFYLFFYCQ